GLFAARREARAARNGQVVLSGAQITDAHDRLPFLIHDRLPVFVRLLDWAVDLLRLLRPVLANDADNPLVRINVRDEIDEDAPGVANGARQVVDKMEGGDIPLPLASHDR